MKEKHEIETVDVKIKKYLDKKTYVQSCQIK